MLLFKNHFPLQTFVPSNMFCFSSAQRFTVRMSNSMKMLHNLALLLLFCLYYSPVQGSKSIQHERKPYIVYMGELPVARTYAPEDHHHKMLATAIGDQKLARECKIHSYGKSFNGFVARLLPHEAKKLQEDDNVVSIFPNTQNKLHTTRSWDYLGLPLKHERHSSTESNIIVGLFDTGISLDCPSFNDKGYGPPPPTWKGKCVTGSNFTRCNKKVIGAKFFNLQNTAVDDNQSPADDDGHGTHTSSTAAGVPVRGTSLDGIGLGTVRGGVSQARIAMYKVCWSTTGCSDMDLLAAFDEAISDGVNVISVSLGGTPREFFSDPMAIGSFHAMKKGIVTSCSAGNNGPSTMTVENNAPWILTVAASSTDRILTTVLQLGDSRNLLGMSVNTFNPKKAMYPLITGAHAWNGKDGGGNASGCDYGTLSKEKVTGKIVYCLGTGNKEYVIKELGGAGTIVGSDAPDYSSTTVIPAVYIDAYTTGKTIDHYINSTKNAEAVIRKTISRNGPAPYVASFSSRGPQSISYNILKPDLSAPGVDILAGYSKLGTLTGDPEDSRRNVFNILSGTSMACPHAAAAAAYIKSFNHHWSPAAIKSALMTTATPMRIKDDTAELGSGSGQINPVRALDPGLVYNISMNSYIAFLCKEGYNSSSIGSLLGTKGFDCKTIAPAQGTDGLNYPSMHTQIRTSSDSNISATFHRTVTNVGHGKSTYKARVTAPKGLSIVVVPDTLKFGEVNQELSFKVEVKGPPMKDTNMLSALLEWNDSKHSVRSPIVIYKPTL